MVCNVNVLPQPERCEPLKPVRGDLCWRHVSFIDFPNAADVLHMRLSDVLLQEMEHLLKGKSRKEFWRICSTHSEVTFVLVVL